MTDSTSAGTEPTSFVTARSTGARWALSLGFAVAFALTVYLGRMTRLEGSTLALVWPAAAVGVLWLASSWNDRRRLAFDAVALAVVAAVINVATGTTVTMGVVFGAANVLQSLVICVVLYRLQRQWGTTPWRLRRSADLGALVTASCIGSLAASFVGPIGLWLTLDNPPLPTMGAWILRNAASTFVFAAIAMRVVDRDLPAPIRDVRQVVELVGASAIIAVSYTSVFGLSAQLPLSYLLLPLSMWLALRFDTTVSAAHVMLTGFFVVSLTLAERGPFAVHDPWIRVLLAQGYVTVTGLVALVLALHRDERLFLIRKLESARQHADDQSRLLEQASEQKSRFLATMSHEIRTPLNGVLGLIKLLTGSPLTAQQLAWAEEADRSGRSLLSIVNDVLDTAKIEAGAIDLATEPFDVLAVVDEALLPVRNAADRKGLSLVVAPAPAFHALRVGDAHRLRQVLTNLVGNAVKFTERGSVTITADGTGDRITLTVVDTGIGLTDDELARLFTPFTQADTSITPRYGGTGLGLAIVRGLVERMAGSVTARSAPGIGSSFTVALPLPAVESALPAREPFTPEMRALGLRVLVAEDDVVNQLVARATLEAHGLAVDVVADGGAAVEAVARTGYAAVFMDCQMTGVDGLEATRRIRAAEQDQGRDRLPVIAMTASAFDDDRRICRAAGMDGFLPKPWTEDQLAHALALVAASAPVPVVRTAHSPEVPAGDDLASVAARLDELFGQDDDPEGRAIRQELLGSFIDRAAEITAAISTAAAGRDRAGMKGHAHALRGSAANIGARNVAACAASVEACADRQEDAASTAALDRLIGTLTDLLPRLQALVEPSLGAQVPR